MAHTGIQKYLIFNPKCLLCQGLKLIYMEEFTQLRIFTDFKSLQNVFILISVAHLNLYIILFVIKYKYG